MTSARFYNDHEFLPTLEEREMIWFEAWENGRKDGREEFEKYLEDKYPTDFKHFRDKFLVNHPEYQP